MAIEPLPSICMRQCVEKWEEALKTQTPEIDDYEKMTVVDAECIHERYEVVHSHQALQAIDDSNTRLYSLVDKCDNCHTELVENVYTFQCPNN